MSDWNCVVTRIEKLEKHPNADSLSIATVLNDYPVVVKTGDYQIGQVIGYVAIDSIVPAIEQFAFLGPVNREQYEDSGEIKSRILGPKFLPTEIPEKYRIIYAKKIRGIYSQGLLVTVPDNMKEGESLVEFLNLRKWEEPDQEDNIPLAIKMRGANAESPPKGWSIPYYDIEGLRKYSSCLSEEEEVVLTEKVNGSNFAASWDGGRLWVKSRNWFKKFDEVDAWWSAAVQFNLQEKLQQFPNKVFFGELYGAVKGFRYDCKIKDGAFHTKVRFFDIYDTKTQRYENYDTFLAMLAKIDLPATPELFRGKWQGKELMYPFAEGKTTLGGKHVREGFVLKPVLERYEERLKSRLILKLVGEGYNLNKSK